MINDANLPATSDQTLSTMDEKTFIDTVADALRDYKDGKLHVYPLANEERTLSPLLFSSLVLDCLLSGETPQLRVQALGVGALLRWAVNQLWSASRPDFEDEHWKKYASLYYPYLEGMTFKDAGVQMALDEYTVHYWRPKALKEVASVLRSELERPVHHVQRKHYAMAERYQVYQVKPDDQTHEQRLLRFCALLRQPMPVQQLRVLVEKIGIPNAQAFLDRLLLDGWLVQTGKQLVTGLRDDEAGVYLRNRLTAEEQQTWYDCLATQAKQQQEYLAAATYWCAGEHYPRAAKTLVDHFQAIVDAGQIRQLYDLHEQIASAPLERNTLAQLKIAVGRAALTVENVNTAVSLLGDALSAPDDLIKAEGYFYLGKAWEKALFGQSHHYFDRGIELLLDLSPESYLGGQSRQRDALLAELYIGKAWLYILHAPDAIVAEEALTKAEEVIGKPNKQRSVELQQAIVNLHNALAGLYALQGDAESEVRHYNNAVMAAREVGDKERLWGMLHNLAQTYIHARQYEPGLLFLAEAEQVATAIESQEGIGKCTQTRGAYHYYQAIDIRAAGGDAQELLVIAIRHYTLATEIFKKLGDDHWLAAAHADLTEAFVALHNLPAARRHYLEAVNRARRSNFEDVSLQVLNQLAEDHPELALKDLSPRLLRIMEIARTCHVITRDDLENEPGFTYTTIRHDLNRLVELGLLVRIGQTRGIKYTLAA